MLIVLEEHSEVVWHHVGMLMNLGNVGWRLNLEVFSLFIFVLLLSLSLPGGHCLTWLGWDTLLGRSPPSSEREQMGDGGM